VRAVRHRIELLLFQAVRLLARALPPAAREALGEVLGRLAYSLDGRHRRIALDNYRTAFPRAPEREGQATVRAAFAFFGRFLLELAAAVPALPRRDVELFEALGREHAEAAEGRGRGVLYFTGHFGGWEFMAIAHAAARRPVAVVARRLDNPWLDKALVALRSSTGNEVIDKREGFRPMLRALRDGKGLAVVIDQNVSSDERIFVDFFGKPAATTPALALLHLKTGAPLVPVFALPLPKGRYRFVYGEALEVPLSGERDEDVRRITQACTRVVEEQVRAHPQAWLWMHRRWKTRPQGEA
jgi:KDO2-lipid IV(A) lauroyltransferase